jgi:hypothetical protein
VNELREVVDGEPATQPQHPVNLHVLVGGEPEPLSSRKASIEISAVRLFPSMKA